MSVFQISIDDKGASLISKRLGKKKKRTAVLKCKHLRVFKFMTLLFLMTPLVLWSFSDLFRGINIRSYARKGKEIL